MKTPVYKISDLAATLGVTAPLPLPSAAVSNIAIDSRSVVDPEATLFIALRTPSGDGHKYIANLYAKGVRNFLVETGYSNRFPDANFIVVADTLKALQQLGSAQAAAQSSKIIAITGSQGKTVTKELLYCAMKELGGNPDRSPRSYNSRIGVPLSLLMMDPAADCLIVEAGVSQPGEMDILASIINPEIGIFTGLTDEHLLNFVDRKSMLAEKLKLFKSASTIYFNSNDKEVANQIVSTYPDKNLIGVNAPFPSTYATDVALVEAAIGQPLPRSLANLNPSTRLDVIEGVNNCKLIDNRFTPDLKSLALAADFMHRRAPQSLSRTLVIASEVIARDELSDFEKLLRQYGFNRLITIGQSVAVDLPGIVVTNYPSVENLLKSVAASDFANEIILLQSSSAQSLNGLYAMIEAKQHETVLEVNLDAVVDNFNFFRSKVKPSTGIICMLKAAGYGAGSVELARTLQAHGAAYIAVAVVDEGVELRQAGITMPVMVLNPRAQNNKMMFDYQLEPEVYSFNILNEIIEAAERYGITDFPIHIKLETGMRRLGFLPEEIPALAARLKAAPQVKASTVFSHLACADDPADDDYTFGQFATFNAACDELDRLLGRHVNRHILNSTGIVRFPQQQHSFVRLGIGLYGIATLDDGSMRPLRPVASLSSVIISIKEWPEGTSIGYNRRTRLVRPSIIATVPIGYADGLDRHLGNGKGYMIVAGRKAPIAGNVCMDITMIDITDIVAEGIEVKVGDHVELFGHEAGVTEMASTLGTIPYEVLTSISPRVKRVYYRE
ncbi:MAG: alanine racemase [Muribaculaceae bacterium]|nr:alanine racemase [Muribaculaceae bacterium]